MKFPKISEMAKEVAEKAFDEYEYQGKTIRQWVEILKDYDDKQTTLQRIVERLEEYGSIWVEYNESMSKDEIAESVLRQAKERAIEIVKEEGCLK